MTQQQAIELVTRLRLHRRMQISTLREENTELIKIIADFDTRLSGVEAQRDELQFRLDLCNATARRISARSLIYLENKTVSDDLSFSDRLHREELFES